MKKTISLLLTISICLLAGCNESHHTLTFTTNDVNPSPQTVDQATQTVARTVESELPALPAATPLDLTKNYTTPLSSFDHITQFPAWKTVPRGHQVFEGVPLDIQGMICLWGEGNTKQLHIVFPEEISGIALKQKFETLYVYHGSFFGSKAGTPVCGVVFRYVDGSSVTNEMLYGDDIIDWIANSDQPTIGPTAARSRLAWVGGSFSATREQPLRLCLTALDNPKPLVEVETVDLYSCKSHTAPCIMAMTPGRSGLMK